MKVLSIACLLFLIACRNEPEADVLYYNGKVYTLDSSFSIASAFAVKDGRILTVGTDEEILRLQATSKVDLQKQFVYPGFIDPHCHFYGYGVDMPKIWLGGTDSYSAVIDTLIKYKEKRFMGWVFGRGWDQNDWTEKSYPDNSLLDSIFPDVPVYLLRIDGHAVLANSAALKLAGVNAETSVAGGEIRKKNGKLSGLLVDNAVTLISKHIPEPATAAQIEGLLKAQQNCFAVGLTSIADAGLAPTTIQLIDSLQKSNDLKMRYNAMVSWSTENVKYFREKGMIKTDRLSVRSFKLYADGALGSRGACLKEPYSDQPGHFGYMVYSPDSFRQAVNDAVALGFQLNTHCIGDSANRYMLQLYAEVLEGKNDHRWRIEHAQVVDESDLTYFARYSIIPSVQPTHATSDMPWAEERIGAHRISHAYSYQSLLQAAGIVVNGSDFPVEDINPLYGFYAAVSRKDQLGNPLEGFIPQEALTREQAMRAMTIWAAYAAFEERDKGSLEHGKFADFVILDKDLMEEKESELYKAKVLATFINGEEVYKK